MRSRDDNNDNEDSDNEDDDDEDDNDDDDDEDDKDDDDKDEDNDKDDDEDSDDDSYFPDPLIVPGEEPDWRPFGCYPWERKMVKYGWGRRETAPEYDSVSDQEQYSYKELFYCRNRKRKFQLQEQGAEVVKVFSYCTHSSQYLIWGRVKDEATQEFKDEIMWVKYPDFPSTKTRHVAKGVKLQAMEAYETREKKEEGPRMTSRERRRKNKEEGPRGMTRELMEKQAKAWMAVKIAKKQWKKLRQELNLHGISPMKRPKKEGKYFIIH